MGLKYDTASSICSELLLSLTSWPLPGDPHASERIGPSCSRTQTGISLGQLVAALKGAELQQLGDLQEQVGTSVVS